MKIAIENSDIVMVVTLAYAHDNIAREVDPYLKNGQIVILNAGCTLKRFGIDHLSVRELTRYETGKTAHQMPIHSCRPELAPISATRKEIIALSGTTTSGN